MKSTKQLEEEDLYHPDISSGLYRTNISELNSVESLKKFKGMLKSTFNSYNNVIYDLVSECHRNAFISEAIYK